MHDLDLRTLGGQHGPELRETGGAAAHHHVRLGRNDVVGFVASNTFGERGVRHAKRAGGAAAHIGPLHLHVLDAGNRFQDLPRLALDALSPHQVAGIVVGDAKRDVPFRFGKLVLDEEFGDVRGAPGKLLGPLAVVGIVLQEVPVFFEGCTARGTIRDDVLIRLECDDILPCEIPRGFDIAVGAVRDTAADDGRGVVGSRGGPALAAGDGRGAAPRTAT